MPAIATTVAVSAATSTAIAASQQYENGDVAIQLALCRTEKDLSAIRTCILQYQKQREHNSDMASFCVLGVIIIAIVLGIIWTIYE